MVDTDGTPCRSTFEETDLGQLRSFLPRTVRNHTWRRLYSMSHHGTSMGTLLRRCAMTKEPCLTIVEDLDGTVFGCLTAVAWTMGPKNGKEPYGSAAGSFLFTYRMGDVHVYTATGGNKLYQYTSEREISAGGGGEGYGLWLRDGLLNGISHRCATYGNECLAATEYFQIAKLEDTHLSM